jgi:hypothetical protein
MQACAQGFERGEDGNCEPVGAAPDTGDVIVDPLYELGYVAYTQTGEPDGGGFMELLDVDLGDGVAFGVGQGGLMVFDLADPASPALAAVATGGSARYHRVEVLDGGLVATVHRDQGLALWDVSEPSTPVQLGGVVADGWEGMAADGDRLWVASRADGLIAVDVSDPAAPGVGTPTPGLVNTWELRLASDGWLYAADGTLGLVPIDISDPDAPVVGDPVDVGGAPYDVSGDGERLYVAAGGTGVVVLDRSDPAAPTVVATLATGATAVMSAPTEDWLYVADHDGLAVYDLRGEVPTPHARQSTRQFALAVDAEGDHAFVGDWGYFETWEVVDVAAPCLDPSDDAVRTVDGVGDVTLTNRGSAPLAFHEVSFDGGTVGSLPSVLLESGGAMTVTFEGEGTAYVVTNDPDTPTLELEVSPTGGDDEVGAAAPDFALPDLEGATWRLSEQWGRPVLLVWFATW